jgi:hypothetical protein
MIETDVSESWENSVRESELIQPSLSPLVKNAKRTLADGWLMYDWTHSEQTTVSSFFSSLEHFLKHNLQLPGSQLMWCGSGVERRPWHFWRLLNNTITSPVSILIQASGNDSNDDEPLATFDIPLRGSVGITTRTVVDLKSRLSLVPYKHFSPLDQPEKWRTDIK